ncbi:envelope protein [Wolbachia endosymbiont of Drosophila ananassae]|nr:envelope protein [Wolbachia endosymbiont of Drosophila ananassae]
MRADEGQTELNIKFQERLNELANAMNQIQKYETNKETHLLEIILAKNRIIITDLENILMGLTLAKLNIVSPAILDGAEVSEFRDKQPININSSLVEILEVSSISVFQKFDILHFLIKFPNPNLVCKRITVYPVQRHNRILNFESGNLVAECPTRNLNISDCKTTVGAAFCKELKNGTCAQQIVSGAIAHCSTLPGHLDPITIVDQGTLIINDANVTVTDDQGREQKVSGTYLLAYSNKVALNGTWFINQLGSSLKKPAVSGMTIINVTAHCNRLSLPFLHELSLSNLHHIGALRERLSSGSRLNIYLILLAALSLCAILWITKYHLKANRRRKSRADDDVERVDPRDDDHLKEGGVNTRRQNLGKVPNCKPDPVARTRNERGADYAFQGLLSADRLGHLRNK